MTTPVLSLRNVGVDLGASRPLTGIDLDVAPGSIVAVVGPNGAGKTTLLDVLTGDVPSTGSVVTPPRTRLARTFQGSPLPDTLTVGELLDLVTDDDEGTTALAAAYGLEAHLDTRVAHLSTGMRRIVDLAVTTFDEHELLLLDEPASGLAEAEIEHLVGLIRRHRDERGATVLLVEHNAGLVERVADEVVELRGGRIVGRAASDEAPAAPSYAVDRAGRSASVRSALVAVSAAGVPAAPPVRHEVSTWTKLRLGLREFAAGMASVVVLGVLNRVMKVELGLGLVLVAGLLASYNLAAPVALAVGHRSDQRPILGRHRSPYIVGGAVVTALMVLAAPHLADRLAADVDVWVVALTVVAFVAMGAGMYGSGTVYFALLADLTPRRERAHAASVVYLMLMAGIVAGAVLSATMLDDAAGGRHSLFAVVAVLVVALNVAAVWGLDPRRLDDEPSERTGAWAAVREVASIGAARRFFVFTLVATVFLFLQQAVLEPFGGEVLGLSVRATAGFNAVQTIGVLVGMLVTGRGIADRAGHKRTAMVGLAGSSAAFAALALAALAGSTEASWLAVLLVGLTTGLFNVAVLALMMAMSVPERVALFMGAWTVSHALADGLATAGGGVVQHVALRLTGGDAAAYAGVFAVEAIGLALCVPLLRGIDVTTFAKEVAAASARRSALAMGWRL